MQTRVVNTNTITLHTGSPHPWPAVAILCLFLVASGIVIGMRYLTEDDTNMERPVNRIAQLYGYSVCLIAVIVFIFSIQSLAENILAASHPLEGAYGYGAGSLTSFEAYKATYREPAAGYVSDGGRSAARSVLSDAELRAQYEALRADRLANARFQAQRDISVSVLMVIIAIVLFALHWRWLRAQAQT